MAQIRIDGSARFSDVLVPGSFIREHMHTASGDHIKVYLMLLDAAQNGTEFDTSAIADLWETTEKDINRSLIYWEKKGLIVLDKSGRSITGVSFPSENSVKSLPPVKNDQADVSVSEHDSKNIGKPEIETEDIETQLTEPADKPAIPNLVITPEMYSRVSASDDFKTLVAITQKYFNRLLNQTDYDLFIHFYYRMGCNVDICETIVECCADKGKLSMKNIDKLSCELLEKGIKDRESIKYFINQKQISERIIEVLGLTCKKLPAAQLNFLNKWFLEFHFSEAMVTEACNRGALKTNGDNAFPYIDSILDSWYKEGITTLEDVTKKDESFKAEQQKKYGAKGKKSTSSAGTESKNKFNKFEQRTDYNFDEDELLFIANNNVKKDDDNS